MKNIEWHIDAVSSGGRFTQRVEGWIFCENDQRFVFRAISDTDEKIEIGAHSKYRPDVVKSLQDERVPLNSGFICEIKDFDKFYKKGYHQIRLQAGLDEYTTLYTFDVKKIYDDTILFHNIDSLTLKDNLLEGSGWMFDLLGKEQFDIVDENGVSVPFDIKRRVRSDVNEIYSLEDDRESGFDFVIDCNKVKKSKLYFKLVEGEIERTEEIDIADIIHQNKRSTKIRNSLGLKNLKENYKYIRDYGWAEFKNKLNRETNCTGKSDYQLWFEKHRITAKSLNKQRKHVFEYNPKISIVIPAYNTPVKFLRELIDSFVAQSYQNWQLCFADGSTNTNVEDCIKEDYKNENRITYKRLENNAGISENTNEAIKIATGDFIMFSDHDDYLEADALFEIVKALNDDRSVDVVYTDEDKVSMDGKMFFEPHFKPDFNPFLLCSNNYITHIFVVNKKIIDEVGMLRKEYDGAQDYDFILRCCEKAKNIAHVSKILYHWRCHPASTAGNPESKLYAYESGVKSVKSHYERIGVSADVSMRGKLFGHYATRFKLDESKKVAIIVSSSGNEDIDIKCLTSIRKNTEYKNYEIIYCVEESKIDDCKRVIVDPDGRIKYHGISGNTNSSLAYNDAVKNTDCDFFVLMNDVMDIYTPGWISDMLGYCSFSEVGAVGVRMFKGDGNIYHAGICLGIGKDKVGAHLLYNKSPKLLSYQFRSESVQNMSAVSLGCVMVKKSAYEAAGGLDDSLSGIYRAIDFSLKLKKAGYDIVYDPKVEIEVFGFDNVEPLTGKSVAGEDTEMASEIRRRWADIIDKGDPYYNPNLSMIRSDYSIGC